MLHKYSLLTLAMLSMIVSTASADTTTRIQGLLTQIRNAQEVLQDGITNPHVSLNNLKEITQDIGTWLEAIRGYVELEASDKEYILGKVKIKRQSIQEMQRLSAKAQQKSDFKKINTLIKEMLKKLRHYDN